MYLKVLVVEDDELDRFIVEKLATASGFAVQVVGKDGVRSAFDYLQQIQSPGDFPEMIILDIHMPLADGFNFLDQFGELPESLTSKSKVIVLTSSLSEGDRQRALGYKYVTHFVAKPLTIDKLKEIAASTRE